MTEWVLELLELAHSQEDLQSILVVSMRVYSRMGLSINTTKTEMVCQWRSSPPPIMPVFTIEHKSLAIVLSFKYLGSILSEDCSIDLGIQNRIEHPLSSGNSLSIKPSASPHFFTAVKTGSLTVTTLSS